MRIFSFSPFGYEGSLVGVEVDLRRGIPAVDIVGLADGTVRESRERMRSAIRNSGFEFPPERVLISLSPADLKKEGAGFDLALALAVLEAQERARKDDSPESGRMLVMGELELNGRLRAVRGVHAAASTAAQQGIEFCLVPEENADEARGVDGMKVFGAKNLEEAFGALGNTERFSAAKRTDRIMQIQRDAVQVDGILFNKVQEGFEFSAVCGQERLVRALQIAAAGAHNVLAFGPPGCGKTLAMQKFQALRPLLTEKETRSVTRIYSIAGLLPPEKSMKYDRPFRQPHQTASMEGICGGGAHCSPGEISLAHNGMLFLDEAAEFKTGVLQMLRVPLETGSITISRAGRSTTFPADFQLLMATNPCPCGFYGTGDKICLCSMRSVEQYWKKFSGPLLDRIDIRVQVENCGTQETGASTAELRKDIARAVRAQIERQGKWNSRIGPSELDSICICTQDARRALDKAGETLGFSPRAMASCLKTARTIADMAGSEEINIEHITEAVGLRKNSGPLEQAF